MRFHHIFSITTSSLASGFNLFMMCIIMKFSSEKIGRYKYFLFFYTLDAALFSIAQFFILPNWLIIDGGYIFTSTVGVLSKGYQDWCIVIWVALFDINLLIICWSFWYRRSCIIESDFFENKKRLVLLGVTSCCVLMFLSLNIVSIWPNEKTDIFFKDIISDKLNKSVDHLGYIGGPYVYNDKDVNWILFAALVVHGAFNTSVITFICYCWFLIRNKISSLQSLSQKRFQFRIYVLLTIQSILPIIFNATPVIVAFTLSVLHWDIGELIQVTGMLICVAQTVDPVCIAFVVADYKRAIFKMFHIPIAQNTVSYLASDAKISVPEVLPPIATKRNSTLP